MPADGVAPEGGDDAHAPTEPVPPSIAPLPKDVDPTVVYSQSDTTNMGTGRRIDIGAYGEVNLLMVPQIKPPQNLDTTFTLRRVVLFFGHRFADWAAIYTELEVENLNEFEIEQSYLELNPFKSARMGLRAGLVLIPLGIINLYHEPPTFNGVDRPLVDQLIIPSTWRELGAGVFGSIGQGLHYQVYGVTGSDGSKFTPDSGIGPGLSRGFTINTQNAAATGRVNYNGILGLDVAAGFYYGSANQRDVSLTGAKVGIVEADARFTRWGLSLRAEYARVFVVGADKITEAIRLSAPSAYAVGSAMQGFYGEAGYNVLHLIRRTQQQLNVFARYEYVNTRAALPDVPDPGTPNPLHLLTAGLSYRPIPQLAFKFDYRRTLSGDAGTGGPDRYSLGIGFMY